MNIVLIGMRGSGKTTVGRILAAKLIRQFVDMDELITRKSGLSIPEIVERDGWEKFRDLETEITAEVAGKDNIINAAGGGVVTRERNIKELKRNGTVVWLTAPLSSLLERTGTDTGRPSLLNDKTPGDEVDIIYNERKELYRKAADLVVDTENKTPAEVAEDIINLLLTKETSGD
jgi:shikimate kinase